MILCASTGCRNRAHTEVYVDNMTAEIRSLEDLVWDYEHESRAMEREYLALKKQLETLRRENVRLKETGQANSGTENATQPRSLFPSPLEFHPRQDSSSSSKSPTQAAPANDQENLKSAPSDNEKRSSILDSAPPDSQPPSAPQGKQSPSDTLPSSDRLPNPPALELPKIEMPPNSIEVKPPVGDGELPAPATKAKSASNRRDVEIDPALLVPPTIVPGEPMPPSQPQQFPRSTTTKHGAPNQLEINLGQIEIPGQLSSLPKTLAKQSPAHSETVSDRRIVEIGFHGTLCRGANLDDQPDDDGLYLVLQPRNSRGHMIPEVGDLSIAALDPRRDGNAAQIGNWHFSAAELRSKLQPIGSSQGIHLSLPWSGPDPVSERVEVVVWLTLANGKRLTNERTIYVSGKDGSKTVWVPRGNSSTGPITASAAANGRGHFPTNLVRPASATVPVNPAPQP